MKKAKLKKDAEKYYESLNEMTVVFAHAIVAGRRYQEFSKVEAIREAFLLAEIMLELLEEKKENTMKHLEKENPLTNKG
jgi:hypothetical protein